MEIGRTLMLDESGDLLIGDNHMCMTISGNEKAAQDIWVRLKSVKGSLETDPEFAIDAIGLINAGDNQVLRESIIRQCLQDYRYTERIDSLTTTINHETRRATITASVTLNDNTQISIEAEI